VKIAVMAFLADRLECQVSPRSIAQESKVCFSNSLLRANLGFTQLSHFESESTMANKAPEPTTFAVTSRASVRVIEMKRQNPSRDAARAAPAKVVAHL
jgi:hypothetical protein